MASALSRMDSDANSESGSAATGKAATGVKALKETKLKKHPALTEHVRNSRLGKELLGHVVFLVIFSIVTIVPVDDPHYEAFSFSMRSMFLHEDNLLHNANASFAGPRFVDVNTVSAFWKWARGPFLHTVYMEDWYKGSPWTVGDQGLIAGSNLVIGTVNLRQKRVKRGTCVVPEDFLGAKDLTDCIADFSPAVEDTDAFGPFFTEPEWATAFAYAPAWHAFHGSLRAYSPGGFALEFPAAKCTRKNETLPCITQASSILTDLESTGWIDYRTRAVTVEVAVYNPPLNRYALIQAVLEMPSSGGILPFAQVRTAKLIRYATTGDFALLGLELALILLVVFDVLEKAVFYRRFNVKIKDHKWDIADTFMHASFLVSVGCRVNALSVYASLNLDPSVRVHYDLDASFYWSGVADGAAGWVAWLVWFRCFKFLHEFSWAKLILDTLAKAAAPLLGLCLSGVVILLAFAHVGLVAFGSQIYDLRSMGVAVASCFRFIFSGMRYEEFRVAGTFLGPIYYIAFKVWMVLIYVRFFVAVIIDAYRQVMNETRNRWTLSFPPLEALSKDFSLWWYERRQRGKQKPPSWSVADSSGEPKTLSGKGLKAAEAEAKAAEQGLTELDAREMYQVLQERVKGLQEHMDTRISTIEKMFVTTVAPLVETLDILVRQQTENAALAAVRAVNK